MFGWMTGKYSLRTRCGRCGKVAAEVQLHRASGAWFIAYRGVASGSGGFDPIAPARAAKVRQAFSWPLSHRKWLDAHLHDCGGYCVKCRKVYCDRHWSYGSAGPCPKGHFQSLDLHWNGGD